MQRIDISEHYRQAHRFGLEVTFLPGALGNEIIDIDWQPAGDPHDVWPLLGRCLSHKDAYFEELRANFGVQAAYDVMQGIRDYVYGREQFDAFEDGEAPQEDVLNAALHLAEIFFSDDDIDWEDVA